MGSKNRINADFLRELADHFAKAGRDAIERMSQEDPAAYIKIVASLLQVRTCCQSDRAARTIGITIPSSFLLRADAVIQ